MPRLVVVLPLTPLAVGATFLVRDWPLHVTVLAPFLTDAAPGAIREALAASASAVPALSVVAGGAERFERRHDIPVTVLEPDPGLTALHDLVVAAVRPFATAPGEAAFTGTEFRAHVTDKHHARVNTGDILELGQIALVDMAPRADPAGRAVLATIPLRPRSHSARP
ncbi:2'-5' RNA ligase family protein [Cryobacterium sp. 10S3]|uniref:2'-5' RNA ligase family protein n=1 Tax=unclassified Cryobacterium TaxID=2649013 RepID=UPI002AC98547|nr:MULTISPECIES: 2'-5' RNA ligase family protein [unclassified Cryobacterium]MEB0002760.1 2'-5' RNA ligase family protein [Cryobacterium sp. RTC2.1]MEB0201572.1 2'-5' RNA ligase family protein [Cryobacterium sp. 5I3]MEB0285005.1 2'-5' RNA ligase family protein [Cryobacterium sp. 10S3]WPX13989.1 2'-5' RNA ligase family protein [Cryobacterium sp. 10S3]